MRSMTGYGRSQAESDGNSVTVEISSVNSRKQIDMRFSIPRELGMLEPEFRRLVQQQLSRGSFQVAVTYQLKPEARQASAKVDVELVQHLALDQASQGFMDKLTVRSTPGKGTTVMMRRKIATRLAAQK